MIAAARSMKKNHILGFLSDKDGNKVGVPVLFMNKVFSFPQGPAVFARKFKAPIIPLFIVRNENGKGHTICVGKKFYYEDTGDEEGDLLRISQKMATMSGRFHQSPSGRLALVPASLLDKTGQRSRCTWI